ncbi:hemK methyltransferase family member 2-like protein [Dinothrombium tinctorium]|uniref:HemK methyltransferase family member 2-like protein n=1 Tax=Dinothrombium tinctorium TaxID=1965070 RepID=A0A3S3QNA9_9ACAR|nr:hemK methyltransferase family member 2-like protein [Dinothrombium tinctorium]
MYIGIDINEKAAQLTSQKAWENELKNFETIVSDLLYAIDDNRWQCVDLLIFNPPFEPSPEEELKKQNYLLDETDRKDIDHKCGWWGQRTFCYQPNN